MEKILPEIMDTCNLVILGTCNAAAVTKVEILRRAAHLDRRSFRIQLDISFELNLKNVELRRRPLWSYGC